MQDPSTEIPPPDETARSNARARLDTLVKPPGSLGRLEEIVADLAALQATADVSVAPASYVLFAADHGVTAQGVSPYPQAVTRLMVEQIASGRAASAVLARHHGMRLEVIDVGVAGDCQFPGVVIDKTQEGTRDFTVAPAMTGADCAYAMEVGARAVERAERSGARVIVLGEMGIGNTTAASALLAALTPDAPLETLVGAGTGLDRAGVAHKCEVIATGLSRYGLRGCGAIADARTLLCAVGGFEIAALTGAMLKAASRRMPVLVDGFIATVAARLAIGEQSGAAPYLIATHLSREPGHAVALQGLPRPPLLDLRMRLGEGTGAGVAYGLIAAAVALYTGMATFEEAGIAGPSA